MLKLEIVIITRLGGRFPRPPLGGDPGEWGWARYCEEGGRVRWSALHPAKQSAPVVAVLKRLRAKSSQQNRTQSSCAF